MSELQILISVYMIGFISYVIVDEFYGKGKKILVLGLIVHIVIAILVCSIAQYLLEVVSRY